MALTGKKQVAEAVPPKPEAAIESVQADVAEIKERASGSRSRPPEPNSVTRLKPLPPSPTSRPRSRRRWRR
jgi:hypothetical protein